MNLQGINKKANNKTKGAKMKTLDQMKKENYIRFWNSHIDELKPITWNLELANGDFDKLNNCLAQLKQLVLKASKNVK